MIAIIGCKEKETYTVTFDSNGGSGTMASQTFTVGESQVLSLNKFTYCTNIFSNWNTMRNGSGIAYTDGQTITVTSDVTLYAQWNMATYTVTFNANGGVGDMMPKIFNACEENVLPQNLFTRDNYWFVGWNTAADGTGISYGNQQYITVSDNITLYAKWSVGMSGSVDEYDYVELGLPSGTKWATCNIGASTPEGYGFYFAWGETKGYKDTADEKKFTWDDYKFGNANEISKYNSTDGKTVLDPEDDAATVNMGKEWRMPTYDEYQELMDNTTWEWIEDYNYIGCDVMKLTSKINGNYIIFPTHGYCNLGWFNYAGSKCYFWTSSLYTWNIRHGCYIDMDSSGKGFSSGYRYIGQSVRGVRSDV